MPKKIDFLDFLIFRVSSLFALLWCFGHFLTQKSIVLLKAVPQKWATLGCSRKIRGPQKKIPRRDVLNKEYINVIVRNAIFDGGNVVVHGILEKPIYDP